MTRAIVALIFAFILGPVQAAPAFQLSLWPIYSCGSVVSCPPFEVAIGSQFSMAVVVVGTDGAPATDYTGTVVFSSSDPTAR